MDTMKLRNLLFWSWTTVFLTGVIGSAPAQFAFPAATLGLNGIVFSVESLASGKVVLGGTFNSFNGDGSTGLGLIRLTSSAAKDPIWDIGFVNNVRDTLVLGNFLYVAGEFTTVRTLSAGTLSRPYLFRMNLTGVNDGKVDTTWTPTLNGPVYHLESDGTSIFLAGSFTLVNGASRNGLTKLTATTPATVDGSWNPSPSPAGSVDGLKFAGTQIYVCGGFSSIGGGTNHYIARLATGGTGAADSLWNPVCDKPVTCMESDASYLYLGGKFSVVNGATSRRALCRFSNGAGAAVLDGTWNPNCSGEVTTMLKSGTALFISGVFQTVSSQPRFFLAKVPDTGAGTVDGGFVPNPNGAVLDMKISGGLLLCGGRFNTTVGATSAAFAKLDATTGAASAGFTGKVSNPGNAYCMLPVAGNKIMIGGIFDTVNGVARKGLARLNSDGTLDASFQADLFGYNPTVADMKVDGSFLYIAGEFLKVNAVTNQHIARITLATSVVDGTWIPRPFTPLHCLETDGTYVYIGSGALSTVDPGNVTVANLARISKTAPPVVDTIWRPLISYNGDPSIASVNDMIFDAGNLIIGGYFTFVTDPNTLSATQRVCLAKLSTTSWGPPLAGWGTVFIDGASNVKPVRRLELFNSSLYVAGDFAYIYDTANARFQNYVAKFNPNGGLWDTNFFVDPFDPAGNDNVSCLAGNGSYLYIGGDFQNVWNGSGFGYTTNYDSSPYVTRVNPTTGVYDQSWYPYPDGAVNVMAFQGTDLWVWGLYSQMAGQSMSDVVILRPTGAAYQTWVNTYFSPAQRTNSDYIAPFWDLDNDGIPNLTEFLYNTDPLSASVQYQVPGTGTSGLPLVRLENISGGKFLTAEYTQWKAATGAGITNIPQFGSTVLGLTNRALLVSTTSIDANRERVKYRDSVTNLPAAFGRVNVVPAP